MPGGTAAPGGQGDNSTSPNNRDMILNHETGRLMQRRFDENALLPANNSILQILNQQQPNANFFQENRVGGPGSQRASMQGKSGADENQAQFNHNFSMLPGNKN